MSEILVETNEEAVIERLWSYIEKSAEDAIAANGVFRIGLSGGSLIKYLTKRANQCSTDWSKWQLYFCDERFVDETNEDSTFGQYKSHFVPKTSLKESQFVTVDRSISLADAAEAYQNEILKNFGLENVSHNVPNTSK